MSATFSLSAFGDEIAADLKTQLETLKGLNVNYLELRNVDGKNVLNFTNDDVAAVKAQMDEHGMEVACIGSPLGKSPIKDPLEKELQNLNRIMEIAAGVGTNRIRIFSFYPPDTSSNEHYDQYVEESADRLKQMAELAATKNMLLMLENEKDIVGDTIDRCHKLMTMVDHPNLGFIWDPANFVQVGEGNVTADGWDKLSPRLTYVHIKDAMLADGKVTPAGEGDGKVPELLSKLIEMDYQGILALEPHLAVAGHSGGFSGIELMGVAVKALRKVMADVNAVEVPKLA